MEGLMNTKEKVLPERCRLCQPTILLSPMRDKRGALKKCPVDPTVAEVYGARAFQQLRKKFPEVVMLDRRISIGLRANASSPDNSPSSLADLGRENMYSLTGQIDGATDMAVSSASAEHSFQAQFTRPTPVLRANFVKRANVPWLEKLWYPRDVMDWCITFLNALMAAECYTEYKLNANVLLAAARFGEAQLYGAQEIVLLTALIQLETGIFQPFAEWRENLLRPYLGRRGARVREYYMMAPNREKSPPGENYFLIVRPEQDYGIQRLIVGGERLPHLAQEGMRQLSNLVRQFRPGKVIERRKQALREVLDVSILTGHDHHCPICFEETETRCESWCMHDSKYRLHHHPVKTSCGHIFGLTCIDEWLFNSKSCPTCRRTLYATGRPPRLYEGVGLTTFPLS